MARTSPVHYIAPSAISITPNANGQADDLAVSIIRGAKVKVCYPPIAGLGYDDASYKEWTLRGRNRRLAEEAPHTIYARLSKTDTTDGYLVFAAQVYDGETDEWQDPYVLSPNTSSEDPIRATGADGERYRWAPLPERQAQDGRENYWWVKLGTVSKAAGGSRVLDLDTGILGTDQYNMDWYLDPDKMPEKPVRVVYEDRGDWVIAPKVAYTGQTGTATPDGTLPGDVAESLGWTGDEPLSFTRGQLIDEPYHWQHLTRDRWLTQRLSEYNDGLTDEELYEQLTEPTRGWEEQNWVETSRVWVDGRLWECLVEGTEEKPKDGCTDWKLLVSGGKSAYSVELTKSSDSAVIDPSGNVVGGYRLVSRDKDGREFYTYRFFTSVTVMKGDKYLHLCGALDDEEEPGEGNFTVEAVGAGCDVMVKGSTCYITFIWHCNDGEAGTEPYTSYNRPPEEYQAMRAMTEAVAHISMLIEGETAVTKDYRLQLAHLPTDTVIVESHNEVAAVNWSTKRNLWTNKENIVIPLTASSAGQPVMFQTKNGTDKPDVTLVGWPSWLRQPGYSVRWADYDEDGDGVPEYTAAQHMALEITLFVPDIRRKWTEGGTEHEIGKTNVLKFNVVTCVDGVEYENIVPFTLNVTTDKAIYVLAPSTKQVVGTMIGGTWDPQSQAVTNARYSYTAAGRECNKVTCRLMSYGADDELTEITSASDIHDALTFFINGVASTLEDFRTTGVQNTPVAGKDHNRFDELSEIVFAVRLDGQDYESEGVPILRNGAQITVGSDGFWYIGGVKTEVFAKGTQVVETDMYYTDPMTDSTPPEYAPPADRRGQPYTPYLKTACPAAVEGKFIHYVSITKFSDSTETYVYAYGTVGTGNTITVIHDRDFYASASKLTQAQLANIPDADWEESVPDDYSATKKYLYARDTARYYKNGAEQTVTVGGISYPRVAYDLLSYWGQDGSGVEFAYYRADDDSAAKKPTADLLNQNHAGTAGDPVIPDWSGSDGGWYDDNPGFTAQGQVMYQSVNKYMGNAWSGWGDPVIIERYAENAVRLDISNEMDMVRTSAALAIEGAQTVETVIHLYDGASEVDISAATVNPSSGSGITVTGGPAGTVATLTPSASGKGKKLSWAFKNAQTMSAVYGIAISYTYRGVSYSAVFTVQASKGQPVLQLKPSHSSLPCSRKSDNTLNAPPALSLKVVKIDGSSTLEKDANNSNLSSLGVTVRYSTSSMPSSSSAGTAWPNGNSVQAAATDSNVFIAMFDSSGVLLDRETIPVIKDGEHGTSPYFADIDNEMLSVACTYDGKAAAAFDKTVSVRMWHGSAEQALTKLTATTPSGMTVTADKSGKTVRVQISKDASVAATSDITITIACSGSGDQTLHLYVNGVRPGKAGDDAVLYDLIPSASHVKRDKGGTVAPTSLTCDVQRIEGTSVSRATSSQGTLRYRKNGDITSSSDGTALTINTGSVSIAGTDTYVVFAFFVGTTMVDKERVPVVYDGDDSTVYSIECADTFKPGVTSIPVDIKRAVGSSIQTKAYDTAYSDWNVRMTVSMSGGGSASMAQGSVVAISGSVTKNSVLSMTLKVGTTIVATKTVRSVADGDQGKYEVKEYGRGSSSTSHADQYMDDLSDDEKWISTIPVPTALYPFIWQRSRVYDPATGSYTSWQYARLTGETGSQGKTGLWYQYAGVWGVDTSSVTNTDKEGWYVKLSTADQWYMNTAPAGTANTTTPGSSGAQNWVLMGSEFKYYIAEAYFGSYAHLGSFIINGDWMISQKGAIGPNLTSSSDYTLFDPAYPNTSVYTTHTVNGTSFTSFNFVPNFAVDGLTGKVYMNDAYVKGQIVATSGTFTGTINATAGSITGSVTIGTYGSGSKSLKLNPSDDYGAAISGYNGVSRVFRLGFNPSGDGYLALGMGYMQKDALFLQDDSGNNIALVTDKNTIASAKTHIFLARYDNSAEKYVQIGVNSSGKCIIKTNCLPAEPSLLEKGTLYAGSDGIVRIRTY